jgi:hypothetical protein
LWLIPATHEFKSFLIKMESGHKLVFSPLAREDIIICAEEVLS